MDHATEGSTPARLLDDAGQPSLAALEELYATYSGIALGLAYQVLGNLSDAEEVLQDVFLKVWRSGSSYNPSRGSARTWLLAIVRHRAIDLLRRRPRVPIDALDEHFHAAGQTDVPAQVASNIDGQRMRHALQLLPPEQLQVIQLAYYAGLTHQEMAEQLAVPLGTIKGRLRLAMDRLRRALGDAEEPLRTSDAVLARAP